MANHGVSHSAEGPGSLCPVCYGEKGMGGIFGCKCADNSRRLAKRRRKEDRSALSRPHPLIPKEAAPAAGLIPCQVCGALFEKTSRSTCCSKACQEARYRFYHREYYRNNPAASRTHGPEAGLKDRKSAGSSIAPALAIPGLEGKGGDL
jgi:hypothetical protein